MKVLGNKLIEVLIGSDTNQRNNILYLLAEARAKEIELKRKYEEERNRRYLVTSRDLKSILESNYPKVG